MKGKLPDIIKVRGREGVSKVINGTYILGNMDNDAQNNIKNIRKRQGPYWKRTDDERCFLEKNVMTSNNMSITQWTVMYDNKKLAYVEVNNNQATDDPTKVDASWWVFNGKIFEEDTKINVKSV